MFCPKCGAQLEDGSVFCGNCGTKISPEDAAATAVPAEKPLVSFAVGKMNFRIVKGNIDFIGCIAAIVAFIALFLPYVTVSANIFGMKEKQSLNFFSGTTTNAVFITIVILCFLATAVFGLKRIAMSAGYATLAFVLITSINLAGDIAEVKDEYSYLGSIVKVYPGAGFYILTIASLVMAFSWLIKSKVLPLLKK